MKKFIFSEEPPSISSSTVFGNDRSITKPQETANGSYKCFASVASDMQFSMKYSKNNVHDSPLPL